MASRRFALLVGSFDYPQEPALHQLKGPPNDIAALDEVLSDAAIGDFNTQTSMNESEQAVHERLCGDVADVFGPEVGIAFELVPGVMDREDHIAAAALRNLCRTRGVQVGTIDALLAQLCVRHDLTLLATDLDFGHMARHCKLRLWT